MAAVRTNFLLQDPSTGRDMNAESSSKTPSDEERGRRAGLRPRPSEPLCETRQLLELQLSRLLGELDATCDGATQVPTRMPERAAPKRKSDLAPTCAVTHSCKLKFSADVHVLVQDEENFCCI
jgi:hypothetical protein